MLTTFFVIGIIGLLLAIVMAFFDGVFDADFGPDGAISGTTLAATLAGFGFGGVIAISLFDIESTGGVVAVAVLVGAIGWGIAFGFYALMHRAAADDGDTGTVSTLVGREATVTTAPAATTDWGELAVAFRGQQRTMGFMCDAPVTVGQSVTITAVLSSTQVRVSVTD